MSVAMAIMSSGDCLYRSYHYSLIVGWSISPFDYDVRIKIIKSNIFNHKIPNIT